MAPNALYRPRNIDGTSYESKEVLGAPDLTLSLFHYTTAFASYLPVWENAESAAAAAAATIHNKRLKTSPFSGDEYSIGGGGGGSISPYSSGSSGSLYNNSSGSDGGGGGYSRGNSIKQLNCLRQPQFRDHVLSYQQMVQDAQGGEEVVPAEGNGAEEEGAGGEMRLVRLLIACAEAVACRDKSQATALLSELRENALVYGTSFQRVASCFVQGLAERLAQIQPLGAVGVATQALLTSEATEGEALERKDEALRLVYEVCPHIQFGHFVANTLLLEAFEGDCMVHVIDLGLTLGLSQGLQWRGFIDSLAKKNPPRRVRITGVGHCSDRLRTIGDELKLYAQGRGINLEFTAVKSRLEDLDPKHFKCYEGEVLAVNSILQLHRVVKESRGALNSVLQVIHELSPKVLVLVEQDSSHNGPFFLGRFMEALHYYSAIFDSLDAMLPKFDTRRVKIEQFYFAEEIKNIVSREGPDRVERHERVDQWRRRMSRAGFQPAPIKLIAQAKQWLDNNFNACEGYTIAEEKGCLVLGWHSKPIVAASCWKC